MRIGGGFKRLAPERPMVIRKGNVVEVCYFYQGMGECFGARCYWLKIGRCPIYERLYGKKREAKAK